MGQTIIEKILSKNLGRAVRAGDEALFEPDLTVAYDYPGYIDSYEKQMDELGVTSVAHPDKFLFFIDHFNPAGDSKSREVHVKTRSFAKRMGIQLWEDVGIGHQVIMEKGYVVPGTMLIHFDGHVSTLGSVGAGAISVRNAVIEALATGKVSIVVPGTLRVNFIGKLEKGVTARDVFHTLVQRLGPSGACSLCLEFGGEGLKNLTMDDRITLCNQAMFLSAVTAVCEQDDVMEGYALGGGLELALACDLRICGESAKLGFPEIGLGIMPGAGGTIRAPRLIGGAKAMEMIFTGSSLSAADAERIGLVNRVVSDGDVLTAAMEMAMKIAKKSRAALEVAKHSILAGMEMTSVTEAVAMEAENWSGMFATYDQKEGMHAFLEKRKPSFADR